jgi:predicted MFS family arabinose efflux permease
VSDSGRRRVFASLGLLVFLVNFGRVVFAPLVDVFIVEFQVGEATAGLVVTLLWLGSAAPRLPTGYLLTRVSRHRVVAGTGVFLAGAAGLTAVAPTIEWVAVGAFLVGVASGVYFIAANPLVSELFPERVGLAVGAHATAAQLAAVAAPALVGVALLVAGWQAVFAALAGLALLATAGLLAATRGAELPEAGASDRDLVGAVRSQWPLIVTGVVLLGAASFVWNGVFNFYVRYLETSKLLDGPTARAMLTAMFAAGVPAMLVTGRLADAVQPRSLLLASVAGFVAVLWALPAASGLLAVGALSVALGYVVHGIFPAADTYVLGNLPDEHRASAYAAFSAAMMLVQATGSVVLGTLIEAGVAYDTAFRAGAGLLAVVVLALAALDRGDRLP